MKVKDLVILIDCGWHIYNTDKQLLLYNSITDLFDINKYNEIADKEVVNIDVYYEDTIRITIKE